MEVSDSSPASAKLRRGKPRRLRRRMKSGVAASLCHRTPKRLATIVALIAVVAFGGRESGNALAAEEGLFVARPLTEVNSFTKGIEGPACDAQGNVYVVNFARERTIGKVTPNGKAEVFVELPGKS